jgi:hypothetical protein
MAQGTMDFTAQVFDKEYITLPGRREAIVRCAAGLGPGPEPA